MKLIAMILLVYSLQEIVMGKKTVKRQTCGGNCGVPTYPIQCNGGFRGCQTQIQPLVTPVQQPQVQYILQQPPPIQYTSPLQPIIPQPVPVNPCQYGGGNYVGGGCGSYQIAPVIPQPVPVNPCQYGGGGCGGASYQVAPAPQWQSIAIQQPVQTAQTSSCQVTRQYPYISCGSSG